MVEAVRAVAMARVVVVAVRAAAVAAAWQLTRLPSRSPASR